jgi:hypothetical protein
MGFSGKGPNHPSERRLGALTEGGGSDARAWGAGFVSFAFAALAGFTPFPGFVGFASPFPRDGGLGAARFAAFSAGFFAILLSFFEGFCFAAFAFLVANAVSFGRPIGRRDGRERRPP